MSSFTNHAAIAPYDNGMRITTEGFRYYVGEEGSEDYVDVPKGFIFDGASVPSIFGIFIQKTESDTITSACLHDYLYIHHRIYGLFGSNVIFLESLIIYTITKKLKKKQYFLAFMYMIKYILMYAGLLIASRFVRYKLDKKIKALFS